MTDTIIADVSEFQRVIDWAAYGAAVPGVIIRAHNGTRPDKFWTVNRDGARAHVPWRGFYQYLPASIDPVAAARAFQAATGPLLPGEVAILDLEEGSGDQRGRRQAWLDALQDPIEWTYSGLAFARAHLPGIHIEWLAAYGQGEPVDAHVMWQFTNARVFPGIAAPCDASVFHGTILPGSTSTSPPRKAPTMRIIKGADGPELYITDGIEKRYLGDPAAIPDLLQLCDQTGVLVIGQQTLDQIPNVAAPIDPAALPGVQAADPTAIATAVQTALTTLHATTTLSTGA